MIYRKPEVGRTAYNDSKGEVVTIFEDNKVIDSRVDKPYVITAESFTDEHPDFEKLSLAYYDDDDTLADEQEEVITDVYELIGDEALTRFGDGSEDPDIVFVRNERLGVDYEIARLFRSYAEAIMGLKAVDGHKSLKQRGYEDDR